MKQQEVKEEMGSTMNIALNGFKDELYSQEEAESQIWLDVWKLINKKEKEIIDNRHRIHKINLECARIGRTREILLLLKAFDLDEAIDKIESTWRDELNTFDTEGVKKQ